MASMTVMQGVNILFNDALKTNTMYRRREIRELCIWRDGGKIVAGEHGIS
jgi:hypothetical protein